MSRDTVFGAIANPLSLNRYGYALDNPLLLADPSGLSANKVTQDTCSDQMNLLHWFCGDNAARLYPFGVLRMNPFDRDLLNALEGALGGDEMRYASGGSGKQLAGSSPADPLGGSLLAMSPTAPAEPLSVKLWNTGYSIKMLLYKAERHIFGHGFMRNGGGRTNFFRVSVEGLGSYTQQGVMLQATGH